MAFVKTFGERVVEIARSIPQGRVATYGGIARAAGGGALGARSVTTILASAYDKGARDIPFHRIVYADGRIWVNAAYRKRRMALYKKEGIQIDKKDKVADFARVVVRFD